MQSYQEIIQLVKNACQIVVIWQAFLYVEKMIEVDIASV